MIHELALRIFQLDENGNVTKEINDPFLPKIKHYEELPIWFLGLVAHDRLQSLYKVLISGNIKMFSLKKPFYFTVRYNDIDYEFIAVKPSHSEKVDPENKYLLFTIKKTELIIKPRKSHIERFREQKLDRRETEDYFKLIAGYANNLFDKSFSPIIYTGMKD